MTGELVPMTGMGWWIVAGILLTGMLLLACSRIQVKLRFVRVRGDDKLTVEFRALYGLWRKQVEVPVMEWGRDGLHIVTESGSKGGAQQPVSSSHTSEETLDKEWLDNYIRQGKELLAVTVRLSDWAKAMLARTKCTELRWSTSLGLGDAADTAVATGIVWGLKTGLLAVMFRHMQRKTTPRLAVTPLFNRTAFATEGVLVAQLPLGVAAVGLVHLLYRVFRVKGGMQTWRRILWRPRSGQEST